MNSHGQTICLTMIVKDEAKVILRCLKSVKDIVDYYYIADTGSTDGTPKIIENYLQENNLKGEVVHHKWYNFGKNRTLALKGCEDKCDYQLTLDADEVFVNTLSPDQPAQITEYLDSVIYHVPCKMGGMTYKRNQLWKSGAGVIWLGVCHEFVSVEPGFSTNFGVIESITNTPLQDGARSQDPNKFAKDAELFENYLKKDGTCARSWFYLGQSYADSGQPAKGIEPMLNAAKYTHWDEERYMAYYRAALYSKSSSSDESFIPLMIKAYETRPQRAEPLYQLIKYGRDADRWKFSELFCDKGLDLKYPKDDVLFVEDYVYDWGLLDEISIAYYWLGRYSESYDICLRLLDSNKVPVSDIPRVKANANFAKEKLGIS